MISKIRIGKTDKDIPYTELYITLGNDNYAEDYEITFRAYYKNVFVAVEDNRDNPCSGADLEDCWIAPTIIIQKSPKIEFNPYEAFLGAMKYGGYYSPSSPSRGDERNFELEIVKDKYAEIEKDVIKWMRQCGVRNSELDPEPDDRWYHDNPNY